MLWAQSARSSYGSGIGTLRCGALSSDAGPPPRFVPDYRDAPTACAVGSAVTSNPRGDVDLLDRRLRMAQSLRASLAYDRTLPWGVLSITEALFTRGKSDFVFGNLNLTGPQAVDEFGRVLYGSFTAGGVALPKLRSNFAEVIEVTNTSRNYAVQLSQRWEKKFANGIAGTASYTYSRVRDVQTPLRAGTRGMVAWAQGRAVAGRHDELRRETSLYDIPHRVVLAGTYATQPSRWRTSLSFYYIGESGAPFTYLAWGASGRGDLNADGSGANDPLYVPRNAFDPNEIEFSGRSDALGADNSASAQAGRMRDQQDAFERFIASAACLQRQRGRIMARNSCSEPMSHTTIAAVRQTIPLADRFAEIELDAFNLLNLLDGGWGHYLVANPALLEHVGQQNGRPQFRFDPTAPSWTILTTESAFQLQLALRYRF